MELVANVWPVADSLTGLVQRFLTRAYAVDADDAPSDFLLAPPFAIPPRFRVVTPHGTLEGCVDLNRFHQETFAILDPAFRWWEAAHAKLQGIAVTRPQPGHRIETPRFAEDPYLVVTVLLEMPDGRLIPKLSQG